MEIPEILQNLESSPEEFPREAVEKAIAHRDDIIPELLRILEEVAASPAGWTERQDGYIFAMYLLAKFRERRAYPLLLRDCLCPRRSHLRSSGRRSHKGFGEHSGLGVWR
jgi:hypothetical protein